MRRIILTVMVVLCCTLGVSATDGIVDGDFSYRILSGTTAEIAEYIGTETEVVIPSEWKGRTITSVGEMAFFGADVEYVEIPDSVLTIGRSAFCYCESMTEVKIGENVQSIGPWGFGECVSLKELYLPDSITQLGSSFCAHNSALREIHLPAGLTVLPTAGLEGCEKLRTVDIPKGVKELEDSAFLSCWAMRSVLLPEGLTTIGDAVFTNCSYLDSITIPDTVTDIGSDLFYYCGTVGTIYYQGSQEEWAQIAIDSASGVESCTIIYDCEDIYLEAAAKEAEKAALEELEEQEKLEQEKQEPSVFVLGSSPFTTPLGRAGEVSYNKEGNEYWIRSGGIDSYLIENQQGYTRIESELDMDSNKEILYAEYYDRQFRLMGRKDIPVELTNVVAFCEGNENYYVFFSAGNIAEDENREVVRVVKYDKNWNRMDATNIYGVNTVGDVISGEIVEHGDTLLVHTGHGMYTTPDGLNHQANLRFTIDARSMTLEGEAFLVSNIGTGYVSHSFNQLLDVSEDGFVVTGDHGDGYPRSMVAFAWPEMSITDGMPDVVTMMEIAGASGDNATGAKLGGLEVGRSHIIMAGTSVTQNANFAENGDYNIWVSTTPRDNPEKSAFTWITRHDGTPYAQNPFLVERSEDSFILIWNEKESRNLSTPKLCWTELNGAGEQVGTIHTAEGTLSDVTPLCVNQDTLVWYTTAYSVPTFYTLHLDSSSVTTAEWNGEVPPVAETETPPVTAPTTPQDETAGSFVDVPYSHWAYDYIEKMVKRGYVNGVSGAIADGTARYNPDGTLTYAEFCTVISRAFLGDALKKNMETYGGQEWWRPYVMTVYETTYDTVNFSLLRGTELYAAFIMESGFQDEIVGKTIDRGNMAILIYNLMAYNGVSMMNETDATTWGDENIADWDALPRAEIEIANVYDKRIITGREGGNFVFEGLLTRSEMATVLCRLVESNLLYTGG